jgi:SAM-dependent methyltransferase
VILFSVYGKDARVDALAAVMAILVLAPVGGVFMKSMEGRVRAGRNFYGSLRIVEEGAEKGQPARRVMMHGSINHGTQFAGEWSRRPTTYYGPDSGAGLCLREPGPARKVGLIGLGAGTLATYGRPGDQFKFYEINPLVVDMARREFTYLKDSAAKVETAVGDGRLLLAAEPPQQFDVLVVDAFSGDSIPVHLLTRESFELYYRHLKPGGLLALHVSNIYLNLQPVVRALAESTGRRSLAIVNPDNKSQGVSLASWALVGSPADLERFASRHNPQLTSGRKQPWTDDFSTLIAALI